MQTALERCKRTTITIATKRGPEEIRAWQLGDFACHQGIGKHRPVWVITFIPKGLALAAQGVFICEDDAAAAMEQIAVEGDWSDLEGENRKVLGAMVKRVFAQHRAAKIVAEFNAVVEPAHEV